MRTTTSSVYRRMPNPKTAIVEASASLPGLALLVTAVAILVKEAVELALGDAGALDPRSLAAVALLSIGGVYLVKR